MRWIIIAILLALAFIAGFVVGTAYGQDGRGDA